MAFAGFIVVLSFAAGFLASEYKREKDRPACAKVAAMSGICTYESKDISTSLKNLYLAVSLDPSNSDAHQGLAFIFYDQGLYDLSLQEYAKYLENPNNGIFSESDSKTERGKDRQKLEIAQAYCNIGDIYYKKGDTTKSRESYQKALNNYPTLVTFMELQRKLKLEKTKKTDDDLRALERINSHLSRTKELQKGT